MMRHFPSAGTGNAVPFRPAGELQDDLSTANGGQVQQPTISSLPRHIRTRRKRYLELHPTYFDIASSDLEISGRHDL